MSYFPPLRPDDDDASEDSARRFLERFMKTPAGHPTEAEFQEDTRRRLEQIARAVAERLRDEGAGEEWKDGSTPDV
jgi:hypothetical protein